MARSTRILVADDDEMVRLVMRMLLTYRGYQVEEAMNGPEAVRKFRQAPEDIDLVLMDFNMPGLNGPEALRELRCLKPELKAILLSGGVQEREQAPQVPGVRYLQKPFENDELVSAVKDLLGAMGQEPANPPPGESPQTSLGF